MTRLPAALRAELEAAPVPHEGGIPTRVCVVAGPDKDTFQVAWMHDGGLRKAPLGPPLSDVLVACAASRWLNERNYGPAS